MENENDKPKYDGDTGTEKVIDFVKKNILNGVLFIIVALFMVKDIIEIQESGKTVLEILATSMFNFTFGFAINTILQKKGLIAGQETNKYIELDKKYEEEINKTDDKIDLMDEFCDLKNDELLEKARKRVLRMGRIKYEDFMTKPKEECCHTKEQEQWYAKAEKVKIQFITPDNLLSETDARYDRGKKEETIETHSKKQILSGIPTRIIVALIGGYFTVSTALNKANILWSALQVAVWLAFGLVSYYQNFMFIQTYMNKIKRKIKYLKEFNNGDWKRKLKKEGEE